MKGEKEKEKEKVNVRQAGFFHFSCAKRD